MKKKKKDHEKAARDKLNFPSFVKVHENSLSYYKALFFFGIVFIIFKGESVNAILIF